MNSQLSWSGNGGVVRDLAAPDIRQVHAAWSEMAEAPGEGMETLLDALLALTNGRAVFWVEVHADGAWQLAGRRWLEGSEEIAQQAAAILEEDCEKQPDWQRARIRDVGTRFKLLITPVTAAGRASGCVALLAEGATKEAMAPFLVILQLATGFFHYRAALKAPTADREAVGRAAALVELAGRTAGASDYDHAMSVFAEESARVFGAYRSAVGVMEGKELRVVAVSGLSDLDVRSTSIMSLQAAMSECRRKGEILRHPAEKGSDPLERAAHQELSRLLELEAVLSIPLVDAGGKVAAVLCLLWSKGKGPADDIPALVEASRDLLSSWTGLLIRTRPHLIERHVFQPVKSWTKNRQRAVMWGAGGLLLLLAWPFTYKIDVRCRIEPVSKRVIASPFDALLRRSMVEPGQIVQQGDALAELDGKELKSRQSDLASKRDRTQTAADAAMTTGDVTAFQLAQLESAGYGSELEVLNERLRNLEVKSPIEGVVIAGELEKAEGVPLRQGQTLFEVAPLERMVVEMEVPEEDISHVREGQTAYFKLASFPGEKWAVRVDRMTPRSELRDGKNVFICEGEVDNADRQLRPGMKGKAAVMADRRALGWILFHKLWGWVDRSLFW